MTRSRLRCLGAGPALTLVLALPTAAAATDPTPSDLRLLGQADVSRAAPGSFRAEVVVGKVGSKETVPLEIWRDGESVLVRFLETNELGKFLLKQGGDVYFLAPGARNPVRLDPRHRLAGQVSVDEIVGLAYSRDFEVVDVKRLGEGDATLVSFELRTTASDVPYPAARYVVREATRRPLRVEHVLASGKVAKILEFSEWAEGRQLRPRRIAIQDVLRGGRPVTVEFVTLEEVEIPARIFDLEGGSEARASLGASSTSGRD
jgi:hypothetical protein